MMTETTILDAMSDQAGHPVTADMTVEAAGLDSLDLVAILCDLERGYRVSIPDAVAEVKTVQEFVTGCLKIAAK